MFQGTPSRFKASGAFLGAIFPVIFALAVAILPILFALPVVFLAASPADAAPGDEFKRISLTRISPQDLAWDPVSENYFVTLLLSGQVLRVDSEFKTVLDEMPSPFGAGTLITGIAYDSDKDSLWVIQPQSHLIAEMKKDGTSTGVVIAPAFLGVVNPNATPFPRGMAYYSRGDAGRGSFFVVESVGSQIYEIDKNGFIINNFDHPDDPDGFPGEGASAGTSDILPILDDLGELSGFYVTGIDRPTGSRQLRRLDSDGVYTGYSIPLQAAGGSVDGFLVRPFFCPDRGQTLDPAVIGIVSSRAEITILDAIEPAIPEIFNLTCTEEGGDSHLQWTNLHVYERVEVWRDGRVLATLDGNADSYVDRDTPEGIYEFQVRAHQRDLSTETGTCTRLVGPGRVVEVFDFPGEAPAELAVDDDQLTLVTDYFSRTVWVFDEFLDFLESFTVTPFSDPDDRLTGIAFRPDSGNLLVYNHTTNVIVEIDYVGDAMEAPFAIQLPNDPQDAADTPNVFGMDYDPKGDEGRGSIWILENRRAMIYEVDLQGVILSEFPHPDRLRVETPPDLAARPFSSGLTLVPEDERFLDLTGGTVRDRDSVHVLRVDKTTGAEVPGFRIPLAGLDDVCAHSFASIARSALDRDPLLHVVTISNQASCLALLDGSAYQLRPVTDFVCFQDGFSNAVKIRFSNNDNYDAVEIYRDGALLIALSGDAGAYEDADVPAGLHRYEIQGRRGDLRTDAVVCSIRVGPGAVLKQALFAVIAPSQMSRDPADGSYLLSSASSQRERNLYRVDADFTNTVEFADVVADPLRVATVAARVSPAGAREIYLIAWDSPTSINDLEQEFALRVLDENAAPIRDLTVTPPRPENGFLSFPTGLTWDSNSDTFYYLERNSATLVHMDLDGNTLRTFDHPAPPTQSFVFNTGLDWSEIGGLFATTAGPLDDEITKVIHFTRSGRETGLVIPVGQAPVKVNAIVHLDDTLILMGTTDGLPEVATVELFDPIAAPTELRCQRTDRGVRLSWSNAAPYDALELYRDGEVLTELSGDATSFEEPDPVKEARVYMLRPRIGSSRGRIAHCELGAEEPPPSTFIRGDADGNGILEITDPIVLLAYQFLGQTDVPCLDALDADDSGILDISDPIALLFTLFLGAGPLPPPYPEPGLDPTPDELGC